MCCAVVTPLIQQKGLEMSARPTKRRTRYGDNAYMTLIASLPREGRVERQARRAFVSNGARPLSMSELREWCYCGRERQHWFYINIKRALRRLGARRIGELGELPFMRYRANCSRDSQRNESFQ